MCVGGGGGGEEEAEVLEVMWVGDPKREQERGCKTGRGGGGGGGRGRRLDRIILFTSVLHATQFM